MRSSVALLFSFLLFASCGGSTSDGLTGPGCLSSPGDVDSDGRIGPADAGITEDIAAGRYVPSSCEAAAADFNGDGVVTTDDAAGIFASFLSQ